MKFKLLWVIGLVCALSFVTLRSVAQEHDYHQLTINDFQGMPRANGSDVIAYTNCTIDFHYQATPKNGYYLLNFSITLQMNHNRSWMDKARITSQQQLAEILRHEQGHYTIAYMEQQELLRTVGRTMFHEDYQRVAQEIFDRIDAKYKQLNHDYDDDTHHMVDRIQQKSWNDYFDKQLAYMPPPKEVY
jgi:hypothetical protein